MAVDNGYLITMIDLYEIAEDHFQDIMTTDGRTGKIRLYNQEHICAKNITCHFPTACTVD